MYMCVAIYIVYMRVTIYIVYIQYEPPVKGCGLEYLHRYYHKLVVKVDHWIRIGSGLWSSRHFSLMSSLSQMMTMMMFVTFV